MPAPWRLTWSRAAERELGKLDPPIARHIRDQVEEFARSAQGDVTRLKGSAALRLRLGEWRVVFQLDHARLTTVKWAVAKVAHLNPRPFWRLTGRPQASTFL